MDLVKIGKYIADKRKNMGMTQKQLAEKLGMSDKSVSKWECGVCLPDVSVYYELCSALGIGINEFLAGEDIAQENIGQKAEENIIKVATDSNNKQKKLKFVIAVLLAFVLIALLAVGTVAYRVNRSLNCIAPVSENSVEMQTVGLLSGPDGAHLYKFVTTDEYKSIKLYLREYRNGALVNLDDEFCEIGFDDNASAKSGEILIVPDFENFIIKIILSTEGGKLSAEVPILTDVENREYYSRSATHIEDETKILYETEQPLVGLIYDKDMMYVPNIYELFNEETDLLRENDYIYLFTYEFCKE